MSLQSCENTIALCHVYSVTAKCHQTDEVMVIRIEDAGAGCAFCLVPYSSISEKLHMTKNVTSKGHCGSTVCVAPIKPVHAPDMSDTSEAAD